MAAIRIELDPRPRKDGLHALKLYVFMNNSMARRDLNKKIPLSHWNNNRQEVTKGYEGEPKSIINNYLLNWRNKASQLIMQLESEGSLGRYSAKDFMSMLSDARPQSNTPNAYLLDFIERLNKQGRDGNKKVYSDLHQTLGRFTNFNLVTFSTIDYSFIKSFDEWMVSRDFKPNSRGFYHSKLRALLNSAGKELDFYSKRENPYLDFKIPKEQTVKRNLPKKDLLELVKYDGKYNDVRDYFLWSVAHAGIDVADYFHLTEKKLTNGRLRYNRRKTNAPINVLLLSEPPLKTTPGSYEYFTGWRKRLNKKLKDLSKDCKLELDFPLTTKVARHTFATLAKRNGASADMISEMLGHASGKVTAIYLDEFHQKEKDKVQKKIAKMLSKKAFHDFGNSKSHKQ